MDEQFEVCLDSQFLLEQEYAVLVMRVFTQIYLMHRLCPFLDQNIFVCALILSWFDIIKCTLHKTDLEVHSETETVIEYSHMRSCRHGSVCACDIPATVTFHVQFNLLVVTFKALHCIGYLTPPFSYSLCLSCKIQQSGHASYFITETMETNGPQQGCLMCSPLLELSIIFTFFKWALKTCWKTYFVCLESYFGWRLLAFCFYCKPPKINWVL